MSETDPFGRDKGEDPLAEMGWSSDQAIRADAGPADIAAPEQADRAVRRAAESAAGTTSPTPTAPTTPTPTPPPSSGYRPMRDPGITFGVRRRNRTGCVFGLVVLVFIGATAAVVVPAVIDAIDSVEEQIDDFTPTVPGVPGSEDGPGQDRRKQGPPPRGLATASLFRRGNLAPTLQRIQRRTGGSRVQLVRLDAANLFVTAARGREQQVATATWKGEVRVLASSTAPASMPTFSWSRIDPSAPNRIVRAATRGRRSSAFDYMVLNDPAGPAPLRWSAFLRNGAGTYSASADGRRVTKVG